VNRYQRDANENRAERHERGEERQTHLDTAEPLGPRFDHDPHVGHHQFALGDRHAFLFGLVFAAVGWQVLRGGRPRGHNGLEQQLVALSRRKQGPEQHGKDPQAGGPDRTCRVVSG